MPQARHLYSNKNKIEIRSPFVYKSIANYMKGKVFLTIKFWADSDVKFTQPDFGKTVLANKKEQSQWICDKILEYLGSKLDWGSIYII